MELWSNQDALGMLRQLGVIRFEIAEAIPQRPTSVEYGGCSELTPTVSILISLSDDEAETFLREPAQQPLPQARPGAAV